MAGVAATLPVVAARVDVQWPVVVVSLVVLVALAGWHATDRGW